MATYNELANIREDAAFGSFFEKVEFACAVKASAILDLATPTQSQIDWATDAVSDPRSKAEALFWLPIAANRTIALAAILGASDNDVQTRIDAAVDKLTGV